MTNVFFTLVLERISNRQIQTPAFVIGRAVVGAQWDGVVEADDEELHVDAQAQAGAHGQLVEEGAGLKLPAGRCGSLLTSQMLPASMNTAPFT